MKCKAWPQSFHWTLVKVTSLGARKCSRSPFSHLHGTSVLQREHLYRICISVILMFTFKLISRSFCIVILQEECSLNHF